MVPLGLRQVHQSAIRGAKSLDKNNSPIFVIDGMIIQEPMSGALRLLTGVLN